MVSNFKKFNESVEILSGTSFPKRTKQINYAYNEINKMKEINRVSKLIISFLYDLGLECIIKEENFYHQEIEIFPFWIMPENVPTLSRLHNDIFIKFLGELNNSMQHDEIGICYRFNKEIKVGDDNNYEVYALNSISSVYVAPKYVIKKIWGKEKYHTTFTTQHLKKLGWKPIQTTPKERRLG